METGFVLPAPERRQAARFGRAHGVQSLVKGIDYQGQWCPVCEFWKGRDRFTGERVH